MENFALVYDRSIPHTTGNYLRSVLESFSAVTVYSSNRVSTLPREGHGLYLCVDDSSHYLLPRVSVPSALWIMDTHMTYRADRLMARRFDYVFAAQKEGADRFGRDGIHRAEWLPLACDPAAHGKVSLPKKYPVAFIGSDGWGRRRRLLDAIRERFPGSFVGHTPHTEIGRIYSQAKIVFNCSIHRDLNMRVFEALCSGSCLVTNEDTDGLKDLFIPGKHLLTYSSEEDALSLIESYLKKDAEREVIAEAGRKDVLNRHTYFHRARSILEKVFSKEEAAGKIAEKAAPWILDTVRLKLLEQYYKLEYRALQWAGRA